MKAKSAKTTVDLAKIRQAIADYIKSEGCDCCRDTGAHKAAKAQIAKLLHVPCYKDKSGYDFSKFETNENSIS